jgi:methylase of polypeptide subunit release factors
MHLYPTHDLRHYNLQYPNGIETTPLTTGKSLLHPWWITGGGNEYHPHFTEAIRNSARTYQHAFEWCSGHGIIGFELLTQGLCQTLAFSDYYDVATQACLDNAQRLELSGVTVYTTPTLADIPLTEQWDLVVGNPPNANEGNFQIQSCVEKGQEQDLIDLALRIVVDVDWQTHEEFFRHIDSHLLPGADVYLTINEGNLPEIERIAERHSSLKVQEIIPMTGTEPFLRIVRWSNVTP